MPGIGGVILTIALVVFAFTTILGWSYFGEKCWNSWWVPMPSGRSG